ncbi:MAG: hypothetical protein H6607_00175 [Flavobacteriales bacterium]|nr:hypothetical protein [Flavobacteriales bacterium]
MKPFLLGLLLLFSLSNLGCFTRKQGIQQNHLQEKDYSYTQNIPDSVSVLKAALTYRMKYLDDSDTEEYPMEIFIHKNNEDTLFGATIWVNVIDKQTPLEFYYTNYSAYFFNRSNLTYKYINSDSIGYYFSSSSDFLAIIGFFAINKKAFYDKMISGKYSVKHKIFETDSFITQKISLGLPNNRPLLKNFDESVYVNTQSGIAYKYEKQLVSFGELQYESWELSNIELPKEAPDFDAKLNLYLKLFKPENEQD